MNKTQLTAAVAEKSGITKSQAERCVNAVLGAIADNLTEGDNEVAIPDFGRFYIKKVAARTGMNPATREKITIPAREKIAFKPSENMEYYSRKHSAVK